MAFFEKSRSLRLISVFETVLTIHDLDIEIAVSKLSSIEYAQLVTFQSIFIINFIINVSIRTGIFPDDWKVVKVIPIYKEDKTNLIIIDQYLFYQSLLNL